jgi:hypothetical protein
MKRVFNCNGSIEEDKEMGEIIQLQGDQRDNARACGGGGGGNGGGVLLFFARFSAPRAPTLSPLGFFPRSQAPGCSKTKSWRAPTPSWSSSTAFKGRHRRSAQCPVERCLNVYVLIVAARGRALKSGRKKGRMRAWRERQAHTAIAFAVER